MEYQRLNCAVEILDREIKDFPIGAISIDDFMPVENKIKGLRTVLKEMSARILYLQTVTRKRRTSELPEGDVNTTLNKLIDETSHCIINTKGINLCLEAKAIEELMYNGQENPEVQKKLALTHNELYLLNDEGLTLHSKIKSLILKQLYLKIETQNEAHKYRNFLKNQELLRIQKLQQSNPKMAEYKQKMEKTIQKINVMKKLITNFIAGSGILLQEKVILDMLENHRDILTLETILNMIQKGGNTSTIIMNNKVQKFTSLFTNYPDFTRGIPYISKNRSDRMTAIAEKLVMEELDVVCLQEIWSINDFKMLKSKTQEQLPYAHYFYSGVVGSGVCILSRYEILDVMFHKWSLNGYVHKIHHGDWFGGKGVGLCKIKVQDININVYVAHLHAEYDRENDEYTAHRVLQSFDTAQFIRMTKGGADVVILGGDLNTEPQDLAYRLICGVAGLQDTCSNSSILGTNECANNSYTNSNLIRKFPDGKRIDYILYLDSNKFMVQVANFKYPFPERVPQKNFSYSDHEAIMAHLKIIKGEGTSYNIDVRDSLKEAINICDLALKSVRRQRIWYLIFSAILIIPLMYSMGLEYSTTSIGLSIGINIGRLIGTAILCYSLFMSSIWNNVEKNALKAGCSAMEIHLTQLTTILNRT